MPDFRRAAFRGAVLASVILLAVPVCGAVSDAADERPLDRTFRRGDAYYHLMEATMAARRGDLRGTMRELELADRAQPGTAQLRAESAGLLIAIGQRREAERVAREALTLDPNEPAALAIVAELTAGRAMAENADPSVLGEAIELYARLARLPEVDDDTLRILANLRLRNGDVDGAIEAGKQLAAQRKGDLMVAQMLTQALMQTGREDEALGVALDFVEHYGEERALASFISRLAGTPEQWGRVADVAGRRLEKSPGSDILENLLIEGLVRAGRTEAAIARLERQAGSNPGDPAVGARLASAYSTVGRHADATRVASDLARRMPGDPQIQELLGESLVRQRDLDGALAAWNRAIQAFGDDPELSRRRDLLRWRMVMLHIELDQFAQARQVADALETPDDPDNLSLRFRVALAAGQMEQARKLIDRMRRLDSPGRIALLEGELFVEEKRDAKARARFRDAAEKLGPETSSRIADIWLASGRGAEGEPLLREWIAGQPDNPQAHFALGRLLERLDRFAEADSALSRSIELDPDNAEVLNYLGYSLADRNVDLERALGLISRALELDPWNGAYLDSLGWVYYRMGRFEEAKEPLERAAREYPRDPTVLDHLGDLYHQLGEDSLALTLWQRALEAEPEDAEAIREKIDRAATRRSSSVPVPPRAAAVAGGGVD